MQGERSEVFKNRIYTCGKFLVHSTPCGIYGNAYYSWFEQWFGRLETIPMRPTPVNAPGDLSVRPLDASKIQLIA